MARLAGDEFGVLLEDITDASDAVRVGEYLRASLRQPFDVDGHQVFTSAAVGITFSATGYTRSEDALQDAAIALQRAKLDDAAPVEVFDPAMRERPVARLRMETDLRLAVERQEFEVYYQPIVALASGRISGFEALARWRHPERGLISPDAFISIAEDTGLIRGLGDLILKQSCRQMAEWRRRYGTKAPDFISVNVSGRARARRARV